MRLLKKLKIPMMCVAMTTSTLLLSACGSESGSAESENNRIRILSGVVGGRDEVGQEYFVRELEERLGMEVEMVRPPSDFDQVLLTSLAAGEQWDIIQINTPTMDNLVAQGALTQLNDIIEGSEILSTHIDPEEWDMVRYDNGNIYGVFSTQQGGTMPVLRRDWMDNLGLETPTTLDEFHEVLRAFTFDDPNGTGQDDTFGLSFAGLFDIQPFMSAAGVRARYTIADDGTRTIEYATEAAIPVLEWLAMLHEEGILDPNFVTNDTATMREMFLTDQVGMVTDWDAWVGLYNNTRLQSDANTEFRAEGILGIEGDNGIMVRRGDPNVWAVPANAANLEGAIEFLEFWHTYEGNILGTLGTYGHTYNLLDDGTYELTEAGKAAGMDHGVVTPNNINFEHPIGLLPGVAEARRLVLENNWQVEISGVDWTDAERIVESFVFRAIRGELTATDAVEQMHAELLAANLIDE